MANVVTHPHFQVPFHTGPVHHSPSALGFGFGLSSPSMAGWPSAPGHLTPWPAAQPSVRVMKRRHEPEDDSDKHGRDDAMERSPTPGQERPKRAAPKRARTTPVLVTTKAATDSKENKPPSNDDNDVDVGVLLASLPPQSLLPLLTSLLSTHPALKTSILELIPRPTVDTAILALAASAKKLRDAYPYSQPETPAGFGYNTGGFGARGNTSTLGFGFGHSAHPHFDAARSPHPNSSSMRDEYIISRLRPHITDFVAACSSYLPYFSYTAASSSAQPHVSSMQSHAAALQSQHKDKSHPSETYDFLAALTTHVLSQPPLTQASLVPLILPRLTDEWKAWIDRVDEVVNRRGGMFGQETVRKWESGLDEFAQAKGHGLDVMRALRDQWVSKVGWLVGRQPMEEL